MDSLGFTQTIKVAHECNSSLGFTLEKNHIDRKIDRKTDQNSFLRLLYVDRYVVIIKQERTKSVRLLGKRHPPELNERHCATVEAERNSHPFKNPTQTPSVSLLVHHRSGGQCERKIHIRIAIIHIAAYFKGCVISEIEI